MVAHATKRDKIRILIVPTVVEVTFLCLSGIVLFLFTFAIYFQVKNQQIDITFSPITSIIANAINYLSDFIEGSLLAVNLVWGILWGIFGIAVYLILWACLVTLRETNETFSVAFRYVHPTSYDSSKYWASIILDKVVFGVAAGVSVALMVFALHPVALFAGRRYFMALESASVSTIAFSLVATLALMLVSHLVVISMRIMLIHYYLGKRLQVY